MAVSNDNTDNIGSSRLLINSDKLRNILYSRNLYTPDVEYPITNQSNSSKIVDAINNISKGIPPFKYIDLTGTVLDQFSTDSSVLTEIGKIMLGKQLTLNSMADAFKKSLPTIKISSLFDGTKGANLFIKNLNYTITTVAETNFLTNFLENISSFNSKLNYPFTKASNNSDFIKNTGTGQLSFLYQAINQNIYKQNDSTLTEYSTIARVPIQDRSTIVANKTYFNFNNSTENPYLGIHPADSSVENANNDMIFSYDYTASIASNQEYAPNADFVNNNFGITNKTQNEKSVKDSYNDWIDPSTEFRNDNISNKLVWGRDGVEDNAENKLAQLHGDINEETKNLGDSVSIDNFNINGGLLEYTKNLLNASEGRFIDITRKAFINNNGLAGFNGSGLWRANTSKYAGNSGISGKQGVRQHTMVDQYDRFAKAIRFNGNQVYGGNEDSVIYNSVLPRVHPVFNKNGKIDNKNLMFSIENLAVGVITSGNGNYGIMDDEYGSPIPICEVGTV